MADSKDTDPTREEYLARKLRWAEIEARVEYDRLYGNPRKARETALAWVGVVECSTMGEVAGYTRGYSGHPYAPPKVGVAAAAPGLDMEACDFRVRLIKAGEEFRVFYEDLSYVQGQVGEATFKRDPNERHAQIATFAEDHVHVFWHPLGDVFPDPSVPVPPTFHLWKPGDEREHEISRLTCSLLRLHKTEEAAKQWTQRRAAELCALHDKNHAAQCKDKACARRGHTYVHRHDD